MYAIKITEHLGRFSTFFKDSSLAIQAVVIVSGISIIAGTTTVAAMVAISNDKPTAINNTVGDSDEVISNAASKPTIANSGEQPADVNTTSNTTQVSQTVLQNNDTQSTTQTPTSDTTQQETPVQTPTQPTYTNSYPLASECTNNYQYTSTQNDSYGYMKCYSSSYTAYKVAQTYGTMPQFWGDPKQWPIKADDAHILRGTTPKVHSVGIQTTNAAGWSAWVEAVHDNGTIDISFYNWNNGLAYGTQFNVSSSVFSTFIYFSE